MADKKQGPAPPPEIREKRRRASYLKLGALVGVLAIFVIWILSNRQTVEVDWLVVSADGPLWLLLLVAAVVGWILGILTAFLVRRRARRV